MVQNKLNKVLFLQDHASTGGAAIAASRYAENLGSMGYQVTVAAGDDAGEAGRLRLTGKPPRGLGRALEFLLPGPFRKKWRKKCVDHQWRIVLKNIRPDLIWVHNLHGGQKWGWHSGMIDTALKESPVVWTLHDMWPLGDGSPYFQEIEIPNRFGNSALGAVTKNSKNRERLRLTAPSRWLTDLANRAYSAGCQPLPYVLNLEEFCPELREEGRSRAGLQPEEVLLLAVAENLEDPRKGMEYLKEAWRHLQRIRPLLKVKLGLIGRGEVFGSGVESRVLKIGPITQSREMAKWLAAADLFVHPAVQDNYPLAVMEAQACGTPVLAFACGGLPEAIEDHQSGWLVPAGSSVGFSDKFVQLAESPRLLAAQRVGTRSAILKKQNSESFHLNWNAIVSSFPSRIFGSRL